MQFFFDHFFQRLCGVIFFLDILAHRLAFFWDNVRYHPRRRRWVLNFFLHVLFLLTTLKTEAISYTYFFPLTTLKQPKRSFMCESHSGFWDSKKYPRLTPLKWPSVYCDSLGIRNFIASTSKSVFLRVVYGNLICFITIFFTHVFCITVYRGRFFEFLVAFFLGPRINRG